MKYHAAVAAELLGDEDLVWSTIRDLENCALPKRKKLFYASSEKVNHQSASICAEDMQPLYAVGWNDDAIYSAITVCALFNFYNRWIDATGVHPMSDQAHRLFGEGTAHNGYVQR